ncbi:unnamed protein product [Nesidiocoris tenuis]|uniref:Uncharacterized protein n=1 Tax=Nesidiocoris tenuis TaxID=355587 RepID=A0A6H5GYE4_9HEMI|nr:unnamed protein product [Nesidiocoris tenuis]
MFRAKKNSKTHFSELGHSEPTICKLPNDTQTGRTSFRLGSDQLMSSQAAGQLPGTRFSQFASESNLTWNRSLRKKGYVFHEEEEEEAEEREQEKKVKEEKEEGEEEEEEQLEKEEQVEEDEVDGEWEEEEVQGGGGGVVGKCVRTRKSDITEDPNQCHERTKYCEPRATPPHYDGMIYDCPVPERC